MKEKENKRTKRKYYLDNVRYFTIITVILFHVIYMFNGVIPMGVVGPFKENQKQDIFQYIVYPWIMVLLFIISGMSSRFYLTKYNNFFCDRTIKLLVPSTIGLLVFGWVQGYYNMLLSDAFSKIPSDINPLILFLIMCVSGSGVLWFIQMLWVFSCLLIIIRKYEKDKLFDFCNRINFLVLLLLGILMWLSAQILNTPYIPVYRFGIYGFSFFLGYFVFSHDISIEHLKIHYIFLTLMSILLCIIYIYKYIGQNFAIGEVFSSAFSVFYSWFASLAILGIGKKFFDKEYYFTRFMSKKSYGIYIFHYLPLSMSAYYLHKYTKVRPLFQYIIIGLSGFFGSIILFDIISLIPLISWCILGINPKSTKTDKYIKY